MFLDCFSPFRVGIVKPQVEPPHLFRWHLGVGLIHAGIQLGLYSQGGPGARPANEVDDGLIADRGIPLLVQADDGEHAVGDLLSGGNGCPRAATAWSDTSRPLFGALVCSYQTTPRRRLG